MSWEKYTEASAQEIAKLDNKKVSSKEAIAIALKDAKWISKEEAKAIYENFIKDQTELLRFSKTQVNALKKELWLKWTDTWISRKALTDAIKSKAEIGANNEVDSEKEKWSKGDETAEEKLANEKLAAEEYQKKIDEAKKAWEEAKQKEIEDLLKKQNEAQKAKELSDLLSTDPKAIISMVEHTNITPEDLWTDKNNSWIKEQSGNIQIKNAKALKTESWYDVIFDFDRTWFDKWYDKNRKIHISSLNDIKTQLIESAKISMSEKETWVNKENDNNKTEKDTKSFEKTNEKIIDAITSSINKTEFTREEIFELVKSAWLDTKQVDKWYEDFDWFISKVQIKNAELKSWTDKKATFSFDIDNDWNDRVFNTWKEITIDDIFKFDSKNNDVKKLVLDQIVSSIKAMPSEKANDKAA